MPPLVGLFVRYAWPLVEPANPFVDGYHVEAITERLEAVVRGEIRKLLIDLPPRCGKSTLLSVLFLPGSGHSHRRRGSCSRATPSRLRPEIAAVVEL